MELYKWYYNIRDEHFQDRWDYPVAIENGIVFMISYIIDAHGKKHIDWSRYNSSMSKEIYWYEDHNQKKPVENFKEVLHMIIREALSV